jgi:hypothetical protein
VVGILIQGVGWVGAALVVGAYLLLTMKRLDSRSRLYHLMNLFGSVGVLTNAFAYGAFPSVSINVIWLIIAMYGLFKAVS